MPARKNKNKKKHHHGHQAAKTKNPVSPPSSLDSNETEEEGNEKATTFTKSDSPYAIEVSEMVGRYMVAKRDLKPGEVLLTEKPLAIGPCVSADAVCLGCYKPVKLQPTQFRCPQCQWPMCSKDCRGIGQIDGHTDYECDFLRKQNIADSLYKNASSPLSVKNLYELILIVRILWMRDRDCEKYKTILLMESHLEMRKKNAELWQHYEKNVVKRLRDEWKITEYTDDEIHKICGILDVNCFEIGQNGCKARSLYPSAFLLAHDCSPNTAHTDDPETFAIVVRASRKIYKDEALTLSYAYTLQGTLKRRDFMFAGKLFWCSCARCADPFELDTDCSALLCPECKKGSVRSLDPLTQESDWKCDGCEYTLVHTKVVSLLDAINNDLESIDAHDVPGLENFMKRYREVLQPNHYLFLSAKYSLCQIYGRTAGYLLMEMSLEDIKRKERYCREFLSVIDKLEPGLTRLRGLIMYELHAPIMMMSQRLMLSNSISHQDFKRNIKEVVKLLRESRDILLMEPVGSSEHEMGLAAKDALIKMASN